MATDRPPKGILLAFEARGCPHTNLFPRTHTQFWMIVLSMQYPWSMPRGWQPAIHRIVPTRSHSIPTGSMQADTDQAKPATRPRGVSSSRTAQLGRPHLSKYSLGKWSHTVQS